VTYSNATNNASFFNHPNKPATLTVPSHNGYVNLSWTVGTGYNSTVVVRKEGGYPSSPTDGTEVYNDTSTWGYNDSVVLSKTFYYSVWSYANWTTGDGEYLQVYSREYQSTSVFTGVSYNITIRYEENFSLVPHTDHTMNITIYLTTETHTTVISSNPVAVSGHTDVQEIRITVDGEYYRSLIPTTDSGNYTMLIAPTGTDADILKYYFTLEDLSGFYKPPNAYLSIYKYNETEKFTVHETHFDGQHIATAYLLYKSPYNRYFADVKSGDESYSGIIINANATTSQTIRIYPTAANESVQFDDIITFEGWATGTQLYINFTHHAALNDTAQIYEINVTVYEINASGFETPYYWYNTTASDFQIIPTITENTTYIVEVRVNHSVSTIEEGRYNYSYAPVRALFFYATPTELVTGTWVEHMFHQMFGDNPLGWTNTIAYIVAVILLVTFSVYNTGLGLVSSGLALGFFNIWFNFDFVSISICILLIVIGALAIIRDYQAGVRQ
jgi:hypothetical protein